MHAMTKRLVGVGALLFAFAIMGVFSLIRRPVDNAPIGQSTVRIAMLQTAIDYAPYIISRRKGWLQEELSKVGSRIEVIPTFQSPPASNEALAANRVDMVLTGDVPTIIGKANGIDINVGWLSCTLSSQTILPISSSVSGIADLKGKKVAVLSGSGPHYWFVKNLERSGVKRTEVQFVDMIPPDAKAAFRTGSVDAWAMFPPWPDQELVDGTAKPLPGFTGPIQVLVAVRHEFAQSHPKECQAVYQALSKARQWLKDNPEEARAIVADELSLPLAVVESAWTKMDWSAELNAGVAEEMQGKADFLLESGLVERRVNVAEELVQSTIK